MAVNDEVMRLDMVEKSTMQAILEAQTLPKVTASDNGDVLKVVGGKWEKAEDGGGGGNPIVEYNPDTGVYDLTPRQFVEYAKAGKTPVNIYIESETDNSVDIATISVFVNMNYVDFGDGTKYYLYVAGEPNNEASIIYCEGYDDKFVLHD